MKPKLYIFLAFLAIITLSFLIIIVEPFQTVEQTLEQKIQEIMTVFSEILCPVYKIIADDLKAEKKGTESEKNAEADLEIQNMAEGPLFPCPPPDDPLQISADIGLRIQRAVFFFEKKLANMKEQLTRVLGTCINVKDFEGFRDVCPPPIGESKSPAPPPSTKQGNCIPPQSIPPIIRKQIINARYNTLVNMANQKEIIDALAKIKVDTAEILEIKRKGEAGELGSSCPN